VGLYTVSVQPCSEAVQGGKTHGWLLRGFPLVDTPRFRRSGSGSTARDVCGGVGGRGGVGLCGLSGGRVCERAQVGEII
jgi:hypothetical protein